MSEAINLKQYRKARVSGSNPYDVVRSWLRKGMHDFRNNLGLSLAYGTGLAVLGWASLYMMWQFNLAWMTLPAASGAMLLGPLVTVGLYRVSRRALGQGGRGIAAPGQIFLVSVVMMVLILACIRSAVLMFAIFYGLRPFSGFLETLSTLFTTPSGIGLVLSGSVVGGLFAALGFAVSVFSFPMLVDRDIDGFSAMGLSFNATTANFRLMLIWAICVTALVSIGILTGLLALIPIFPILGFATWHAYSDLFQGDPND